MLKKKNIETDKNESNSIFFSFNNNIVLKLSSNDKYKFDIKLKINFKNKFCCVLFYLIIYLLIVQHSCYQKNIELRKLNLASSIKIIINKSGNQQILSSGFTPKPSKVTINNGVKTIVDSHIYNLNKTIILL